MNRDQTVAVRVMPDEKVKFSAAADRHGLGIGPWLRMLGMRECRDMAHNDPRDAHGDLPKNYGREAPPEGRFQVRAWYTDRPSELAFTANLPNWVQTLGEIENARSRGDIGRIVVAHHPSGQEIKEFNEHGPISRETGGAE